MFVGVIEQLLHYSGAIIKWSDWVCKWGGCCQEWWVLVRVAL